MTIDQLLGRAQSTFIDKEIERLVVHFQANSPDRFLHLPGFNEVVDAYNWAAPSQVRLVKDGEVGHELERQQDIIGAYSQGGIAKLFRLSDPAMSCL